MTSGLVEATLNYGTISIVDEKLDFCDLITQINKNCPVPPGPFNLHFSKTIPDFVPSVRPTRLYQPYFKCVLYNDRVNMKEK